MESCRKHPKYKGKRVPKNECLTCLLMYTQLFLGRVKLPRPQPPMKTKKQYKRVKKKHAAEEEA